VSDWYDDEIVKELKKVRKAVETLGESFKKLSQAYSAPDPEKPVRELPDLVVDKEGDIWRKQADGTYTCEIEPENYYGLTLDQLEKRWGPLE
jgi:hypothetical protein